MTRSRQVSAVWLTMGLALAFGLSACGDTWQGFKQDTKDNVGAVGEGMQKAGEKVEETAE